MSQGDGRLGRGSAANLLAAPGLRVTSLGVPAWAAALLQCSLPPVTHHLAGCPVPSLPALGSAGSLHLRAAGFYCVDDDYLGGRNDSKFTFSAISVASFGDYGMLLLFSTYCLGVILMVYFK